MSERLCVVMPVYNEEEAIGGVLKKWSDALSALDIDFTIRPYNDGSKDSSLKVMRDFVAAHPEARVDVRDKKNGGHGHTILTGYREAAADGFDWVFQIDSDDEMGPEKFGELWSHREDKDFLVGIRDGRVQTLPRKIISFVSRLCVRLFYGKSIWDVNTPYRLMRVSAFKKFYSIIPESTFAPNVILSGLAAWAKVRCFEMRVSQHDRTTGEVSIKKWKLFKAAAKSFAQTIWFSLTHCRVWIGLAVLLTGLAVWLAMQSTWFFVPGQDDQVYQLAGKIQSEGGQLYRDYFDHKGPIFLGLNWIGYALCPGGWGICAVEFLIYALALSLLFLGILKRLNGKAAILFCAGLLLIPVWPNRPETFAVEMSVASLGILLLGGGRAFAWLLTGVLASFVFFSKQTSIGFFVGAGIFALLRFFKGKRTELLSYVLGGLLATVVIVGLLACKGILCSYWDCCYRFNSLYGACWDQFVAIRFFGFATGLSLYVVVAVAAVAGAWKKIRENDILKAAFAGWLAFELWDFCFLVLGQGPWGYQYAVSMFALLVPSVIIFSSRQKGAFALIVFVALAFGLLPRLQRTLLNVTHRFKYGERFVDAGGGSGRNLESAIKAIEDLPPSSLFIWGSKCEVYARTGRMNPLAPYYYHVPFNTPSYLSEEWMSCVSNRIESAMPCVILDAIGGDLSLSNRKGPYANDPFRKFIYGVLDERFEKRRIEGCDWPLYVPREWR